MTFRRLIGRRTTMSNADARDIIVRYPSARRSRRVFITRRDSGRFLDHVQELVASGHFEPVVARERGTAGGPSLQHLIEQMRGCDTAIIHVIPDAAPADADRQPRIRGDVLLEIGAAMALYGREFVLLVEEAVELPPFLQGLCACHFNGNEASMPAIMRALRAFNSVTKRPSGRPSATSGASSAFGYVQQADETKH
jgi:predicted nucleotide-binding protein